MLFHNNNCESLCKRVHHQLTMAQPCAMNQHNGRMTLKAVLRLWLHSYHKLRMLGPWWHHGLIGSSSEHPWNLRAHYLYHIKSLLPTVWCSVLQKPQVWFLKSQVQWRLQGPLLSRTSIVNLGGIVCSQFYSPTEYRSCGGMVICM